MNRIILTLLIFSFFPFLSIAQIMIRESDDAREFTYNSLEDFQSGNLASQRKIDNETIEIAKNGRSFKIGYEIHSFSDVFLYEGMFQILLINGDRTNKFAFYSKDDIEFLIQIVESKNGKYYNRIFAFYYKQIYYDELLKVLN